ncbi:MAG TPA: cytochrome c [Candidatus Sulfotelmatobacter sp.]|nr:cytochrome c [Candidatus Sulfotelmatobacter sp.]
MKNIFAVFVLLWIAAVAAAAQAPPANGSLVENPIYKKDCAKCHGKTGEGRHFAGPSLLSEKAAAGSNEELRSIIANGKHHMPKFEGKLTAEEIDTLVRQIKQSK